MLLPSILGARDVAVPIGDVPYPTRIMGWTEYLPVVRIWLQRLERLAVDGSRGEDPDTVGKADRSQD